MSRRTFKLSYRHDEDESPGNALAVALAFAFLGLANTVLNVIPGGSGAVLPL
ncbi:MAG TPA: hypothetical protein VMU06_07395 [Stellaceae bacterium]|nr:hypothetical protein [Stellaceae bacterium]